METHEIQFNLWLRLGNKYTMILLLLHRAILHRSVSPHRNPLFIPYFGQSFCNRIKYYYTLEACQSQFGFFQWDMHKFELNRLKKSPKKKHRRRLKCNQPIHLSVRVFECIRFACFTTFLPKKGKQSYETCNKWENLYMTTHLKEFNALLG